MAHAARVLVVVVGLLASGSVLAAERTVRLAVDGMTCPGCSYIVKKTLASMPGVAKVDVSLAEKAAVVTFDDAETDVAALAEATAGVGFPSRLAE
jgi:periplasmic mercuric ion binding protein